MDRKDWIIVTSNSEISEVIFERFRGTVDEVKIILVSKVKSDKANDDENWDYGDEMLSDVEDLSNGLGHKLVAQGNYTGYHITYNAEEFAYIADVREV